MPAVPAGRVNVETREVRRPRAEIRRGGVAKPNLITGQTARNPRRAGNVKQVPLRTFIDKAKILQIISARRIARFQPVLLVLRVLLCGSPVTFKIEILDFHNDCAAVPRMINRNPTGCHRIICVNWRWVRE